MGGAPHHFKTPAAHVRPNQPRFRKQPERKYPRVEAPRGAKGHHLYTASQHRLRMWAARIFNQNSSPTTEPKSPEYTFLTESLRPSLIHRVKTAVARLFRPIFVKVSGQPNRNDQSAPSSRRALRPSLQCHAASKQRSRVSFRPFR